MTPHGGQTSSSCGGLVAFGYQMGALRTPWLVKLKFGALSAPPPSSFCGGLMAFVHLIWAMFVYGSGCFFCFIPHGTSPGSFLETCVKIRLDLAEVFRILKCLFVYLFVYWFVCFYFNNLGAPTGSYPENLERSDLIWLIYLGSKKCLFVYLFVYWFVCFIISIILRYPQDYTFKISWRSDLI